MKEKSIQVSNDDRNYLSIADCIISLPFAIFTTQKCSKQKNANYNLLIVTDLNKFIINI